MNTYYNCHPDNYFHNRNVEILAKSIEAENSRDPKELENIFKELELNIRIKNDAIKEFKENTNVQLMEMKIVLYSEIKELMMKL